MINNAITTRPLAAPALLQTEPLADSAAPMRVGIELMLADLATPAALAATTALLA